MRQGAQGWCTGMTLRDGMGREVGGWMGNTCAPMADSCQKPDFVWQNPPQYCKVISLQLKLIKKKKQRPYFTNKGLVKAMVFQ